MTTTLPTDMPGDELGTLLNCLEAQRAALVRASYGLTEEQAASRPTASELSLSGLIKHVAEGQTNWLRMAQRRPSEVRRSPETWHESFRLVGEETIPQALAFLDSVNKELTEFVRSVPSLDETFPLPDVPWFPQGEVSIRWMLLHLIREMAQHTGHADIIRESLDGKTSSELVELEAAEAHKGTEKEAR
ncbi:DinB family protein [Streptomyces sp. NPDC048717]|uniref:DinB family protein n=1 Tax=Streptomyces sp. NPDC048717 TaxID=3154928 RepID=UPI00343FCEA0